MKIKTKKLINDLVELTSKNLNTAESLNQQAIEHLKWKSSKDEWNALECIEHLNLYGEFYLREIEQNINQNKSSSEKYFKGGLFGNYFAKSMLPKENLTKMNTFKDKNPIDKTLEKSSLDHFIEQQQQILSLLDKSKDISLNKTKVPISLSKWIKLKLGDVFRVVIYHNKRHLVQARKMTSNSKSTS